MDPRWDGTRRRGGKARRHALSALCGCLFSLLAACGSSGGTSSGSPSTPTSTPTATVPTSSTPMVTYKGHSGPVISVAWSPDGTRVASCGNDGTAQVWQASDGKSLWQAHVAKYAFAVAWAPDGKTLAAAGADGT